MNLFKNCIKCKKEKPPKEFNNNQSQPDGKNPYCQKCSQEYQKSKSSLYKNKSKSRYLLNREKILAHYHATKQLSKNPPITMYKGRQSSKIMRIKQEIKKLARIGSTNYSSVVGCTGKELQDYFQKQFKPDMSWENVKIGLIIAMPKNIDISNLEERYKYTYYTNLKIEPLKLINSVQVNTLSQ